MIEQIISKIPSQLAAPIPLVEGQWLNITFDVPILVDISVPLTATLITIYTCELFFIVCGMFLMVYFNYFINTSRVIHVNLQYLLCVCTGLYLMASAARFYMLLVQFKVVTELNTPFLLLAGIIRLEHYGLSLSSVLVVTVERSFATYYVIDYESKRRVWVAVFCGFIGFVYTQFFVIPITFFKAPLYYILLFSSLWAFFATLLLFGLQKFNAKELQRLSFKAETSQKTKWVNYTLSKKFQVEENVKVIRLLLAMSSMMIALLMLVIIFLVVPRFYFEAGTSAGQVMISLFDINVALGAIFIPIISIWRLRKTRELPFTKHLFRINKSNREKQRVNPITVFDDATKTYFDQFRSSWR